MNLKTMTVRDIMDAYYHKRMEHDFTKDTATWNEAVACVKEIEFRCGNNFEKSGRWDYNSFYEMYQCSECWDWQEEEFDFCPNCGARMN